MTADGCHRARNLPWLRRLGLVQLDIGMGQGRQSSAFSWPNIGQSLRSWPEPVSAGRMPVRCVGRTPAWCREPIRPRMPTNGRSTANRVCRCCRRVPGSPGLPGLTPCDTGRGTGARACSGTGHIATRPRQAQRAPRDGLGRARTTMGNQINEPLIIYLDVSCPWNRLTGMA